MVCERSVSTVGGGVCFTETGYRRRRGGADARAAERPPHHRPLFVPLVPSPAARAVAFAKALSVTLTTAYPRLVTNKPGPANRTDGRVYVDWIQQNASKTTAALYTLRVHEGATRPAVSTPLTWEEVEHVDAALSFGPREVLTRVAEHGDLATGLVDPAAAGRLP